VTSPLSRSLSLTPTFSSIMVGRTIGEMRLLSRDDVDIAGAWPSCRGHERRYGISSSRSWFPRTSSRRAMLLTTFGRVNVDLNDLVGALLRFDGLSARQWLADAARSGLVWSEVPVPVGLDATERAVAAGVAELLASRAGQSPPGWTAAIPPAPEKLFLVRAAATMPRLRAVCEQDGPEPLRRRGLLAPPDFLSIA